MKENVKELLSDDAFMESIIQADSSETVKKIFAEKGITLSDEQIEDIREKFVKTVEEVSKEELAKISGGVLGTEELKRQTIGSAGMGGAIGLWAGAGIGFVLALVKAIMCSAKKKKFKVGEFLRLQMKYVLAGSLLGAGAGGAIGGASGALLGAADVDLYAPKPPRKKEGVEGDEDDSGQTGSKKNE